MKKFIITALLAAMPLMSFAQSVFDKFEDVDGIETVIVNKELFNIAGNVKFSSGNEKADKFSDLVKNIDNLKVFITEQKKHKKALKNTVDSYLKNNTMEKLLSVNDDGSKVSIYIKQGDQPEIVKEALVFVEDNDETVLLSFTGTFNLNELKGLK